MRIIMSLVFAAFLIFSFVGCDSAGAGYSGVDIPDTDVVEEPKITYNEYGWSMDPQDYNAFDFIGLDNGLYTLMTVASDEFSWPSIVAPLFEEYFVPIEGAMIAYTMEFAPEAHRELDKIYFSLLDVDGNEVFKIVYKPKMDSQGDLDGVFELEINGVNHNGSDYIKRNQITPNHPVMMSLTFNANNRILVNVSWEDGNHTLNLDMEDFTEAMNTEIVGYKYQFRGGASHTPVEISPATLVVF